MENEEKMVNLLAGLSKDLSDDKFTSIGVAINCILQKHFVRGSQVGFKIGRRHYYITRDE